MLKNRTYNFIASLHWKANTFKKWKLKFLAALGVAYHTKKYDFVENWQNKAISTDFTYAFRMGLYYTVWGNSQLDSRINLNYLHYSNGHIQWPNNGINTIALGLNITYNGLHKTTIPTEKVSPNKDIKKVNNLSFPCKPELENMLYIVFTTTEETYIHWISCMVKYITKYIKLV